MRSQFNELLYYRDLNQIVTTETLRHRDREKKQGGRTKSKAKTKSKAENDREPGGTAQNAGAKTG